MNMAQPLPAEEIESPPTRSVLQAAQPSQLCQLLVPQATWHWQQHGSSMAAASLKITGWWYTYPPLKNIWLRNVVNILLISWLMMMIIIWLMMVNNNYWLVVEPYPSEK